MKQLSTFIFFVLFCTLLKAQAPGYTANDIVKPYTGNAFFGTNMGWHGANWSDDQLADLAAGNPNLGITGVGVQTLRPSLPEHFVLKWGYDIRLDEFQHYQDIGIRDNTCFIGDPMNEDGIYHRETTKYCDEGPSELFANIYLPIWDNGENGTPVNDENFYALYVYNVVNNYKNYVKFWEIWNEPDYSYSANSTKKPGEEGSWWDNDPDPCDYKLQAPVQHYIRTLRISYEVIKSIDPEAYVAVGGLGYPSFLDAMLRNSDNPDEGKITDEYPLGGGAYFDVLSFHSYPHIDGSLRDWNNDLGGFDYFRHSDAAVEGVLVLRDKFQDVLDKHSYNGVDYPLKRWIITEINIPRIIYTDDQGNDFIGSDKAQINFVMKSLLTCKMEGIDQYHIYSLAEGKTLSISTNEFDFMGLYKALSEFLPYEHSMNESGIGYHTTAMLMGDAVYDPERSKGLDLPSGVKGGAFKDTDGEYTYALWVETSQDLVEDADVMYSFPVTDWDIDFVEVKEWDYSKTKTTSIVSSQNIQLTSRPMFFSAAPTYEEPEESVNYLLLTHPNPFSDHVNVSYYLKKKSQLTIEIADVNGRLMDLLVEDQTHPEGQFKINYRTDHLPAGIYFCRLITTNEVVSQKIVKRY